MIRKKLRARDIPPSWNVQLPDDPDALVTVVITPSGGAAGERPLMSFIGAGRGVFKSPREADRHIRQQRDAWRE